MKTEDLLAVFAAPGAEHRSCPYWVWNGAVTKRRITEMLEQYAAQGCGGVTVHARVGLITEYLSERWFELWGFALAECKRLGLHCNIFDENGYPPPSAGGHVFARIPYAVQQSAVPSLGRGAPPRGQSERLGVFRLVGGGAEPVEDPAGLEADAEVLTVELRPAPVTPWIGGMAYVDPLRPEVTRAFIDTTHEAYRERFGADFGSTIHFAYNDEVGLRSPHGRHGVPMSAWLLREFRRDHGYDLRPKLADLFVDSLGAPATRFDYYSTVQRLFEQNYFRPLYEWCDEHGLAFTGHLWEHCWPEPFDTPDCMATYRWFQVPGVDVLAQQFAPDEGYREENALTLLTVKEASGAANQLGRVRKSCEAYGGIGYEATLRHYKRRADWFLTHGLNLVVEHLSYQSTAGLRKYDWPQTFSDHSPWWEHYRPLADHTARLCVAGSVGLQICRVLVLHPTTTAWLLATPLDRAALRPLRAGQSRLVQWLCDRQVDFDLGDELLMRDLASAEDGWLRVGEMAYDVVVLPEGMENLCESTVALLEAFLGAGGTVLALADPPTRVNGRENSRPSELAGRHSSRWLRVRSPDEMLAKLDERMPPLIACEGGGRLPPGVAHQARELPDGRTLHLLANTGFEQVNTTVRLRGAGVLALNTLNGEAAAVPATVDGDCVLVPLDLPPGAHAVWLVSSQAEPPSPTPQAATETIEVDRFDSIERTAPNLLQLDFCDLTVGGETHEGIYVLRANELCWRAHGFDQDVWRNIQYRRNFVDMTFGEDTGFDVEFAFEIAPADFQAVRRDGNLRLAFEHPELYRVRVNGQEVPLARGERWFDETIRAASISEHIRPGVNRIRLSAQPFHILCEIDRIYVLGEFGLEPASLGFRVVRPLALALGDWARQGLPFYNGSVRYRGQFGLARRAERLVVEAASVDAAAITASLDGGPTRLLDLCPRGATFAGSFDAGEHELLIEVFTGPRNLLGPHFWQRDSKPIGKRFTGAFAWLGYMPRAPVDGAAYELAPYGLTGPVHVTAMRDPGPPSARNT